MTGRRRRCRARSQAGLTLVELMIAMVVASFALAAAMAMAYALMNGLKDHRRAVAVERNARAAVDYIARALKTASPGSINGEIDDLVSCGGLVPAIELINSTTGPDRLRVLHASGGGVMSLTAPVDLAAGNTGNLAVTGVLDNTNTGGFMPNVPQLALIVGGAFDIGHVVVVTPQASGAVLYQWACPPTAPANYDVGSLVIRVQHSLFYVDDTNFNIPLLMMDPSPFNGGGFLSQQFGPPQPLADGIEDFQVAVGIDGGNGTAPDGEVHEAGLGPPVEDPTTDEYFHNVIGDAPVPPLGAMVCGASGADRCLYRSLRITIAARSTYEVQAAAASYRTDAEDHAGSGTADPFKRRALTTVVELRNLDGSP